MRFYFIFISIPMEPERLQTPSRCLDGNCEADQCSRHSRSRYQRSITSKRRNERRDRSDCSNENPGEHRSRRRRERRSIRTSESCSRSPSRPRGRLNSKCRGDRHQKRGRAERGSDGDSEINEAKRSRRDVSNQNTTLLIESFLDIMKSSKFGSSEKFSSLNQVIPEFDPMIKEQTINAWISKVEECKQIYEWSEKQVVHYALPKLEGIAKTWYQSLPTLLHSWEEWKVKLIETFPSSQNYGELLTEMLNKKLRFGESPELYYYAKINLLNRCNIHGKNAVDCIVYGIDDRGIRLGAQAAQFTEPEQLLKFLKNVKPGTPRQPDRSSKDKEKRSTIHANTKGTDELNKSEDRVRVCYNCNQPGHPSYKCNKPTIRCTHCKFLGHLANACPKADTPQRSDKEKSVLNIAS